MRKLYVRFALTMLFTIAASTFLGTVFTFLLFWNAGHSPQDIMLAMRTRDFFVPLFTIVIGALVVAVTSKKAVAPIVALSGAARQIAQGNLEAQIQVSKRKDEIGELERDFSLMVKELRSNQLMRKDFIANISHEFKTPLSIIEGYAQLLSESPLDDGMRTQYAQIIQTESERLHKLSLNILRLSRLDTQTIQTDRVDFRLDEQIRQTILSLEPRWSKRDISFDISLEDQWYRGDEELLSQVWLNLIENAVKFSPNNSCIRIRLNPTAAAVEVEITDSGVGMDPQTQVRAFEQFFQGEASHNSEGSGLGLAIVKRIIDLHGGEIEIVSSLGKGTKVLVRLPR